MFHVLLATPTTPPLHTLSLSAMETVKAKVRHYQKPKMPTLNPTDSTSLLPNMAATSHTWLQNT